MSDTMPYIFTLGNHPELAVAELWSVMQQLDDATQLIGASTEHALIEAPVDTPLTFLDQLGGTRQIGRVVATAGTLWSIDALAELLAQELPPGEKVTIGLGTNNVSEKKYVHQLGVALKKGARARNTKVRFVLGSGTGGSLNAAQITFNSLTERPHRAWQIGPLSPTDETLYVNEILRVQNIAAYARRDTDRPQRDAKTGMLPPKVAQIALNIATTNTSATILDPFCGIGTVLQEGWLMGHTMFGSDKNERMVRASEKNLAYLSEIMPQPAPLPKVTLHDATQTPSFIPKKFLNAVVTEPFLGAPLTKPLPSFQLRERINTLGKLYLRVFTNLAPRLKSDGRIVFLLPAFRTASNSEAFELMPERLLDQIEEIGYRRVQLIPEEFAKFFPPHDRGQSIYARPDALVGREVTVWEKHENS